MRKPTRAGIAALTLSIAILLGSPASAFIDGYEGVFGVSGLKLSEDDRRIIGETVEKALDTLQPGQNMAWKNPKTGAFGSVTPLRKGEYKGMKCQEYILVIKAPDNPQAHQFRIPECFVPGEGWKMAF